MTGQPEPAILVIFGITGDLAGRYLLPALYSLVKDGRLHDATHIIGVTRSETSADQLFERVELCVNQADGICDPDVVKAMRARTEMFRMNLDDPASYDSLLAKLNAVEDSKGVCMHRIYYLSIPPAAYQPVVRLMGERGLNSGCQHGVADSRLLVEKPFGYDLVSAEKLLDETGKHFKEEQVFRIDHYMAKEPVLEFLKWRVSSQDPYEGKPIKSVTIMAKEAISIEGRAAFYDPLGALRDFIQNHLMQIASLVLMARPASQDSTHVHAVKEAALDQLEPIPVDKISSRVKRGQYRGYKQEVNNPESQTETFVSLTLFSNDKRWQGKPVKLLTGKALDQKRSAIDIELAAGTKSWDLSGGPNAYERVITDAISGDHTVFASHEEILASWRILQPVLEAWQRGQSDLAIYEPGSAGLL